MRITDELRVWAHGLNTYNRNELQVLAIADRIDTEHERGMEERADRYSELRAKMNNCYVELPKDADGEYIHIGDVMEWVRYKDGDPTIVRTVSGIGNGVFFAWSDEQGRYAQYEAHAYRHHYAPTVEDVLREMLDKWGEMPANMTNEAIVAEYAAKLRLAGGDE